MNKELPEDVCLDRPVSEIWAQSLEILSRKLPLPTFESWIRPTRLLELSTNQAVIAVNNDFARQKIATLSEEIESALQVAVGRRVSVKLTVDQTLITEYSGSIASIVVAAPEKKREQGRAAAQSDPSSRAAASNLNPSHIFSNFVVGSSNQFSHAAALSVADKPGQAYNPLFLYGDVGLGKTHLLHAIGNAILEHAPNAVIRYMSCEKFTNELINSIRDQSMVKFRARYRQVDVLLMDDIQFLEGKESTQEEFFHTFNQLRENGKQIVLTSDRPPAALSKMEQRLRSRFEQGLIADIKAPNYETRLAILQKKAQQLNPPVPGDVLDYIAKNFTSNIRELEGALTRAHAYANLTGAGMTTASLSQVLLLGNQKKESKPLTLERIIDAVASYYRVEPADIRSSKRSQDLTVPRHVAMYIAHENMSLSFPRIGQAFGNRKHTSVKYAYDKVKEQIPENQSVAEALRQISRLLDA